MTKKKSKKSSRNKWSFSSFTPTGSNFKGAGGVGHKSKKTRKRNKWVG